MDSQELLARVDERTTTLVKEIQGIKKSLENRFVTYKEFTPVRLVVFSMVGLGLTWIGTSVLGLLEAFAK